ncbi:transcription factor IBH1-like 1 [Neltuma alba]|uniref:transcription factor IBH1-like 1 n=1 Tax=Neltuma alba TaxID=207710 RepID=UPI0010A2F1A1|nr:transcription factor IBH1-like 1 [Prosopis alba]
MQNPRSEKLEFLQKWMEGMGKFTSLKKNMSLLERKKAIKVSADLAMASTRTESKCWSRALIANIASRDHNSKVLTEHVIGSSQCLRLRKAFTSSSSSSSSFSQLKNKRMLNRTRKIMKRRRRTVRSRVKKVVMADSIARRLVQKRTEMLKRLVPGGDLMDDDVSLIEETLDYIQSLRSQVQAMRCLLATSQLMKCS